MCRRYKVYTLWATLLTVTTGQLYTADESITAEDVPTINDVLLLQEMQPNIQRLLVPALIYELFAKTDPYKNQKAHVRTWEKNPTLSADETAYLKARDAACNAEIAKLVGRPVALKHTPRIAFLGSGGGMRTSIFTSGALKALAEAGLIDTCQYIGGVSGSTWTILPWQVSGKPFDQFYPLYIDRVVYGLIPQTLTQGVTNFLCFTETIVATLLRTLAFLDIPSSIDIYGLLLGLGLLGDGAKVSYSTTNLSSLAPFIKDGKNPLPLCTAIIPTTKEVIDLDVIECTPLEVIDYSSNTAVPAWACGRTFKNGVSTNIHPSLTIGFLMGIFGSSFTAITLKNLWPMILEKLWPKELFAPLTDLFEATKIGNLRVFPAHVRNFSYGMKEAANKNNPFNLWVDAGIGINIPIVPFLKHAERNIDIYIICDAGGDVKWSSVINQSEAYARKNNYLFPHCDSDAASTRTLSVFDDGPQSTTPIVIYMPMIKNSRYNPSFDPQDMMYNNTPGNFLASDNFLFTREQAELLAGLASFSVTEAKDAIINAIKAVVDRKERGLRPPILYGDQVRMGRCARPAIRTPLAKSSLKSTDQKQQKRSFFLHQKTI